MSNPLTLPTRAWAVMTLATSTANRFRYRRETGGWLLARAEAATEIVAATGPGEKGELHPAGVWISRAEFDSAARSQGFLLAGEWHLHPDGETTEASEADKHAWRCERLEAGAGSWPTVILARGKGGTWESGSAVGFVTTRAGCERVELSPRFGPELLAATRSQAWCVNKGPFLRWPSTWKPGELEKAVAMLEVDDEAYQSVQLRHLNERLERLGFSGNLRPVGRQTQSSARSTANEVIHGPDELILRPGIGRVLGVR